MPSPIPVKKIFNRLRSDLAFSGVQATKSVFSRLDFSNMPLTPVPAVQKVWRQRSPEYTPVQDSSDEQGVDLSLNLNSKFKSVHFGKRSYLDAVVSDFNPVLTGANRVPLGHQDFASNGPEANSSKKALKGPCFRCFSPSHHRNACVGRIRCVACFRLGHVAQACLSPRFPGLSGSPLFSGPVDFNCWDMTMVWRWFTAPVSLTSRPDIPVAHDFTSLAKTIHAGGASSSAWKAPSAAALCHPQEHDLRSGTVFPPSSSSFTSTAFHLAPPSSLPPTSTALPTSQKKPHLL